MRGVEQIPWVYDLMLSVLEWRGLGRWRRQLVLGARGRTLDLGCGTGRNLPLYAGARPVGVDPSLDCLHKARRRAPGVPLVRARAEALPFRDATFATVVGGLVLCSVDAPADALAEVARVLVPGGEVRLLEHVRSDGVGGRVQDALQPLWTRVAGGCRPNRRTESSVEQAGFEVAPGRRARGTMRLFNAKRRTPPTSG